MKKRFFLLLLVGCLLLSSMTFVSCERPLEQYSTYSLDYFDTFTKITGYARSQDEFDRIAADILAELGEYHRLYDIYHRYEGLENLCTINALTDGVHSTVTVDARIIDMLLYAKEMYQKTGGRVNVAMGSVLSIWHEYRDEGSKDPQNASLPPMDKLREAAEHTDIDGLVIDG